MGLPAVLLSDKASLPSRPPDFLTLDLLWEVSWFKDFKRPRVDAATAVARTAAEYPLDTLGTTGLD